MNLNEFSTMLQFTALGLEERLQTVVQVTAHGASDIARAKIGNKQLGWEELAPRTKQDKAKLGFQPPHYSPLLRKGDLLKDMFSWSTGLIGVLESNDPKIGYLEFGTAKMPPRPIIGPSMEEAVLTIGLPGLQAIAMTLLEE